MAIRAANYDEKDYQDLIYLADKRQVQITVQAGTKAGIAAGLCVMAGVIVAGPVGAAVGGTVGTAMAMNLSKNVVGLKKLLEDTPRERRPEIIAMFGETFKEEFMETINGNPELKLLLGAATPIRVVRYMVERGIIQDEGLKRVDMILSRVS